jgi:cytochrome c2
MIKISFYGRLTTSFLIFSVLAVLSTFSCVSAAPNLSTNAEIRSIESQYFTLRIREVKVTPDPRFSALRIKPIGGASITSVDNDFLIGARASGQFFRLHINTLLIEENFLPEIDTGAIDFARTSHYSYSETAPRILGLTKFKSKLIVAYNFYDKSKDRINFRVAAIDLATRDHWNVLWISPDIDVRYFALGNGGKLTSFGDYVYFSVGDQSLDRKNGLASDFAAQQKNQPWGKIHRLRIKKNGTISHNMCSYGHRNPQGITSTDHGQIFSTEHGPRGGDKLNLILCGKNYGWPNFSYGTGYASYGIFSDFSSGEKKFQQPIFYFTPSPSLSALVHLRNFSKEWDGQLLAGSLKDKSLYRIRLGEGSPVRAINIERIQVGVRIRDLAQTGSSIIISSDNDLLLILERSADANPISAEYRGLVKCSICHSLGPVNSGVFQAIGPSLSNIFNQPAGGQKFSYSQKFYEKKLTWSESNLRKFLKEPNSIINGTSMPNMNLSDSEILAVIADLKKLSVDSNERNNGEYFKWYNLFP